MNRTHLTPGTLKSLLVSIVCVTTLTDRNFVAGISVMLLIHEKYLGLKKRCGCAFPLTLAVSLAYHSELVTSL